MSAPCLYCHRDGVCGSPSYGLWACASHDRDVSRLVGELLTLGDRWRDRAKARTRERRERDRAAREACA